MELPKLELLCLCNYASFGKTGAMSVIDIFDEIYADIYPASFSRCFLALSVSTPKKTSQSILKVQILPPDESVVLEKEIVVKIGENGRGNFILEMVNLNLPMEGQYKIKVGYGDQILGGIDFSVVKPNIESSRFTKLGGDLVN